MKSSFPIRIKDNDRILSQLDLHQIENVIWLQLCPHVEHIASVKFEFDVLETTDEGSIFRATCKTELFSGSIVESTSVAESKVDTIVSLGKKLWGDVGDRLKHEQTGLYRYLHAASDQLRRLGSALRWKTGVRLQRRQPS